ncbi:MAG: hypothetical protein L6R36_002161 [Xanthoria steineri]|nr:MAG: hypothetical protein L6R36_002161 [Xanthoria steineri]
MADGPGSLRDILAFSLRATTADILVTSQDISTNSKDHGSNRLVKGILFSRQFILSYQAVLLASLLCLTIWNWTNRLRARKPPRQLQRLKGTTRQVRLKDSSLIDTKAGLSLAEDSGGGSSSSSTIQGNSPSPKHSVMIGDCEQTPLLLKSAPPTCDSIWLQFSQRSRSILLYQPRPIPLINKTFPSNGTTLLILALLAIQVFYVFYRMPLSVPMLFVLADRTSLLFVANLPLLYLFAAKNQPIKFLTGYSYESLNILHRRLGEVMCLLALIHSAGMIGVWYTILRPVGFGLVRFLLSKIILLGLGALVAYELIYLTSLGSFRRRWYELFLVLHVTLQIVALVLLWFHHHGSRPYVGVALAIFLVDRLVYRMALKVESSIASLEVTKDQGTVVLRTSIPLEPKHWFLKRLMGASVAKGWTATEHVFLTVPALSRKHVIQAHPFTIASKAPEIDDLKAELKLIVRAQDGFSGDLLRYARGHTSVKVRLDAPYGSQNGLHMLEQCDVSIVVAGGSGIAVALPLVWAVHASHSVSDLEICQDMKSAPRTILIWVVREDSHTSWLGSTEIRELRDSGIEVIIPPPTATNGKPDVPRLIESCVVSATRNGHARIGVVCSGPDGMNRAVRNFCASFLASGYDIDVEIEKFGW